tara:strand:- start:15949 stop:16806 length:858 start_codon:yes stop_codon:yes gene_type:complete
MKKTSKYIFFFLLFLVFLTFIPFDNFFKSDTNEIGIITIDYPIASSDDFSKEIDYLVNKKNIKDIVIRLNTPGGGVAASQEIFSRIIREREKHDINFVSSISSVAASGGYYIAIATNKIFANPGSITGSIGVIMEYPIIEELMDRIGIEFNTIKSSEYKDSGSPFREMSENETLYFQDLIDDLYEQFINEVSNQRDIPINKVKDIANGKIYSGRQALELGLIDTLGTFNNAIEYLIDINGYNEDIKLVKMPNEEKSIFDFIFNILSYKLELSNDIYTIPQYLIVK